jgi:hypothetical protein
VIAGEDRLDPEAAAPYYAGVGFKEPPAAFLAGTRDINACLVGTSDDGVVVAFRGTLPVDGPFTIAKLHDWVNDVNARPVAGDGLPGRVHEGFLGSLDSLWTSIRAETQRQLQNAGPAARLLITGHSKGGAMAALAAMRFHTQERVESTVITIAAAKAGDQAFCEQYNAVVDHTRYEFGEDVVPHLPPSGHFLGVLSESPFFSQRTANIASFEYGRAGKLLYITRALEIVPDPDESLLSKRRERILRLVLTGRVQTIGDDHRIGCGYGYMSALNPTGVCPT